MATFLLSTFTVLYACISLAVETATINEDKVVTATAYLQGSKLQVKYGVQDKENGIVYGSYEQSQNVTGWAVLNIAGGYGRGGGYSDEDVMRAAGYLEGVLTQPDIYDTYRNQFGVWFNLGANKTTEAEAKEFYSSQRKWMEEMITKNQSTTWKYISLIYSQFKGLIEGYQSVAPSDQRIDEFGFDFLSGNGDWLDIKEYVQVKQRSCVHKKDTKLELEDGHCSALIKVLPGYENVFASHSTWYLYASMLRVYKHYSFNLQDAYAASKTMSFSSYPGYLCSLDDFYIMDSEREQSIVMLQTTNSIISKSVYEQATPKALLAWHRVRLANWLADNGRDWGEYIKEYNSGTYNNQYMVLDLKRINLTNYIDDNALWIVEQIPGLVVSGDQTAILREGYWASYNVPFYEEIYTKSGYPTAVTKEGPEASHDLAPRAKIFRRDQGNVKDMSSMEHIMRFNGFMKNDPLAEGSPYKAICSRGDLLSDNPRAGGCTDTKVTDYNMALAMKAYIQSGPTHQDVPVFQWSTANVTAPHYGQPDRFDFDFILELPNVP